MTRTYKGCTIDRNMNGNWIVTFWDGLRQQCATLKDAKEAISFRKIARDYEE